MRRDFAAILRVGLGEHICPYGSERIFGSLQKKKRQKRRGGNARSRCFSKRKEKTERGGENRVYDLHQGCATERQSLSTVRHSCLESTGSLCIYVWCVRVCSHGYFFLYIVFWVRGLAVFGYWHEYIFFLPNFFFWPIW